MYLYLGGDFAVLKSDIIGVFDIDTCTTGKNTNIFLNKAQKEGRLKEMPGELPSTFIVTKTAVYLSQISTKTLQKQN